MLWIILTIGSLAIVFCSAILIAPKLLHKFLDFLSIGSRIYLTGVIRLSVGVMLLILATQARFWGYVVTLGLLAAAAGLSLFFFPLRRTKKLLSRLQNQSNLVLRLLAIFALIIWALLIYALLPAVPVCFLR